jgi:Oxidoreductase family, NAD-binding Rossmann fold
MNRRTFLEAGATGLAWSSLQSHAGEFVAQDPKRVGLIGSGWYGKADLFRLIQVAPVEVVSLCDVDSKMLAEAAELTATRQASKKKPRTYSDYRKMLAEKDLDIVLIATPDHWHALPMIAAVERGCDRGTGHGRRRAQAAAGCAGGNPAPQYSSPRGGSRPDRQGRQARQDWSG